MTPQVLFNVGGVGIAALLFNVFADPDNGTTDVVLTARFFKVVSKTIIVDQPFAVFGAIAKVMFDDFDAIGKENTQGRKATGDALVKAA
jgi:hypothetical protein